MTADEPPVGTEQVRSSLRRLTGPDCETVVERAVASTEDVEAAAGFVRTAGLGELEAAIEATDDPEVESAGRRALDRFREFRRAAAGEISVDHFHPAHGTDLRSDDEPSKR